MTKSAKQLSRRTVLGGSVALWAGSRVLRGAETQLEPASDCVFCQIIGGTRDATFVWRDDACVAFGSIRPLQPGHVLLVPRRHVENIYELPSELSAHLLPMASRLGRALKTALRADGLTLLQNNEKAAGQSVPHFHIHLIPRHAGQEVFKTVVDATNATEKQLEAVLAPVRKALGSST